MKVVFYLSILLAVQYYKVDAAKGPFKATIVSIKQCKQPTYPFAVDPPLTINLEIYNTSKKSFLLRGNVTVTRENQQVKLKIKSLIWQNGEWKVMQTVNNIGCHSVMLYLMMKTLGIKYNRENCGFLEGQYYFEGIDPDILTHFWSSEMEYGRIMIFSEVVRGTLHTLTFAGASKPFTNH